MQPIITDRVTWSVSRSVCHSREPCKNGWTDRDAVCFTTGYTFSPQNCPFDWGSESPSNVWFLQPTRALRNHVLDGVQIPMGRGNFEGRTCSPS